MRYEIPQFIDVEDTLIGSLTFKQVIYLIGGGSLCYIIYTLLPLSLAIFFMIPIGGLGLALAFYKLNTRPFIEVLQSFSIYLFKPKSYLWKRVPKQPKDTPGVTAPIKPVLDPKTIREPVSTERRIHDLSRSLDLLDR